MTDRIEQLFSVLDDMRKAMAGMQEQLNAMSASKHASTSLATKDYNALLTPLEEIVLDATIPDLHVDLNFQEFSGFDFSPFGIYHTSNEVVGARRASLVSDIYPLLLNTKRGTSEAGQIPRDTALLNIVCTVAGLSCELNQSSSSTTTGFGYRQGWGLAPFVFLEQKNSDLQSAIDDLKNKIQKTEAYRIPGIPTIATAGDFIEIGLIREEKDYIPLQRFNMSDMHSRARALVAAINLGRYGLYVHNERLIDAMEVAYYKKQVRSRCEITIHFDKVTKKFTKIEPEQKQNLLSFHKTRFPFVEHLTVSEQKPGFTVELTPVGIGLPSHGPSNESELKQACRCILFALHHMHQAGWVAVDLYWLNIIRLRGSYYIIDTEFVSPHGSKIPTNIPRLQQIASTDRYCTPQLDLRSLAAMVLKTDIQSGFKDRVDVRSFVEALQQPTCTAYSAFQHSFLRTQKPDHPFAGLVFYLDLKGQQLTTAEAIVHKLGGISTNELNENVIYFVSSRQNIDTSTFSVITVSYNFLVVADTEQRLPDAAHFLLSQNRPKRNSSSITATPPRKQAAPTELPNAVQRLVLSDEEEVVASTSTATSTSTTTNNKPTSAKQKRNTKKKKKIR